MSTTKVPLSDVMNSALAGVPAQNRATNRDTAARGVHSSFPLMTPKYARWIAGRNHEFENTMARMFIRVDTADYDAFLASLEDDETRTIARYLTGDEKKKGGVGYIDFFLQTAQHSLSEKVQVTEVLSDNYVAFFFGQQAPVFNYGGSLMNTYEDDWTMRMYRIFQNLGRGTQLAKRGQILRLKYDSMIVSGAMLNFAWNLEAGKETYCDFNFSFLVKNIQIIYGSMTTPTKTFGAFTPAWVTLDDNVSNAASQTYLGGNPSAQPEGCSSAALVSKEDYYYGDNGLTGKTMLTGPQPMVDTKTSMSFVDKRQSTQ